MAKVAFDILGKNEMDENIEQLYTKIVNDEQAYNFLLNTIESTDEQADRMDVRNLEIWQFELNRVDSNRYDNYYAFELIYIVQKLMDRELG